MKIEKEKLSKTLTPRRLIAGVGAAAVPAIVAYAYVQGIQDTAENSAQNAQAALAASDVRTAYALNSAAHNLETHANDIEAPLMAGAALTGEALYGLGIVGTQLVVMYRRQRQAEAENISTVPLVARESQGQVTENAFDEMARDQARALQAV